MKYTKIFAQSREFVIDTDKYDIWVDTVDKGFNIVAKGKLNINLGTYDKAERAKEVLKEIFQFLRCKKSGYAMPEQ